VGGQAPPRKKWENLGPCGPPFPPPILWLYRHFAHSDAFRRSLEVTL